MRDYGKVATSIWNSKKFAQVDDDARLLYLYLHTCPHVNSVGCFVLKEGYALTDLGWVSERYRKAIDTLLKAYLIGYNLDESLIRINNFLRFDPFTNAKHAAGAIRIALMLPNCDEKLKCLKEISQNRHVSDQGDLTKAIDRLSKGYRNPEPEPEPDKNCAPLVLNGDASENADPPKKKKSTKGTRLPEDWKVSKENVEYAKNKGMNDGAIAIEAEKFKNYWLSASGANATKVNWDRTWQNWIITAIQRQPAKSRNSGASGSMSAMVEGFARAGAEGARKDAQSGRIDR